MKAMLEYTLGTVGKPHERRMNATVSRHLLEVAVLERPATAPSLWKGIELHYSVEGVDQVPLLEGLWFVGNAIIKSSAASGPMVDIVAKVAAFLMLALRRSGPRVKATIAGKPFEFSPREIRLSAKQLCIPLTCTQFSKASYAIKGGTRDGVIRNATSCIDDVVHRWSKKMCKRRAAVVGPINAAASRNSRGKAQVERALRGPGQAAIELNAAEARGEEKERARVERVRLRARIMEGALPGRDDSAGCAPSTQTSGAQSSPLKRTHVDDSDDEAGDDTEKRAIALKKQRAKDTKLATATAIAVREQIEKRTNDTSQRKVLATYGSRLAAQALRQQNKWMFKENMFESRHRPEGENPYQPGKQMRARKPPEDQPEIIRLLAETDAGGVVAADAIVAEVDALITGWESSGAKVSGKMPVIIRSHKVRISSLTPMPSHHRILIAGILD